MESCSSCGKKKCECSKPIFQILVYYYKLFYTGIYVSPEKFQFLEKWQNRNFDYKIVISVKNPEFILLISDDKTDFTVGINS